MAAMHVPIVRHVHMHEYTKHARHRPRQPAEHDKRQSSSTDGCCANCTCCCKCIDTSRSSHTAANGSTCRMISFAMLMHDAMHHNCKMHVSIHVEIVQHHVVHIEL